MTYSKGGRGKQAPYKTTHSRVPEQLTEMVRRLSIRFKDLFDHPQEQADYLDRVKTAIDEKDVNKYNTPSQSMSKEEAIAYAKKLIKAKKSKQATIEKLLTGIYDEEVSLD